MKDVYNNTLFERNAIQTIPSGYIDSNANDLFRFMGSFWKNIHKGTEFIKGISNIRGIKLAQFFLDLLESLKLQDRNGIPVFHRELWKPLIIRKSQRNTTQENVLKIGGDAVLGEQSSGSKYGEGTVLRIGSLANFENYVTYPVDGDMETIASGIYNNVINPTVSYKVSSEFPSDDVTYINGTLIFPIDKDPFGEDSGFEIYDVVDDVEGSDSHDLETTLWASDVLIDRDFVSDHMSYALGIDCPSSDIAKRIINAGWDAINCGLTPELYRTLIASMLNIPVIQELEETVKSVTELDGEDKTVVTDSHVYTVYKTANIRKCVKKGSVLHRGDLLDESVKIYPLLTDVSDEKLAGITEYADILKEDVPMISIPRTILRTNTAYGLSVDWDPTPVLDTGDVDSNGHRKLYFDIGGSQSDVDAFWEDVWDYAERWDVDIEEYLEPYKSDSDSSDQEWNIIPAEFFLKYMIGSNTLIVTLDRSQVEDMSMIRDPMFFNILNATIPSGMRLFFIEHVKIDSDDDTYMLGDYGDHQSETDDYADQYALEDIDDEIEYDDLPGMKGRKTPSYSDQIEMKLFRLRKRNAN